MSKIIIGYVLTFGWVFFVLLISAVSKKLFKTSDETSRKIVHCLVAFAYIPMVIFLKGTFNIIIPPLCFVVLNYISVQKDLFSMMERHNGEAKSYGTVYYALSMAVMALVSLFVPKALLPFGCGMFCMALGDGLAPFFGSIKKGNITLLHGRTLYGSLCVLLISLIIELFFIYAFHMEVGLGAAMVVAVAAAVLELIGVKGLDNIILPIGVFLLNLLFT